MKTFSFFLLFLLFGLNVCRATSENSENIDMQNYNPSFKNDAIKSFSYLIKASYVQFTQPANLVYAGMAAPALWYSFEHDKRLTALASTKKIPKYVQLVGDFGVVFNFPVVPLATYCYGRYRESSKVTQFAMEYFATLYLSLAESGLFSFIPIHERPSTQNISFWEEAFRGDSSFPSGHVVPYASLFFKTFQFYGPYWAMIPAALFYFSALERVRNRKHYVSDVVGAFFLTAAASEGVRAVAGYDNNHPVYKWIFERQARVGLLKYRNAIGPMIAWRF